MFDQPKTINAPGIDTPLREQTLAEFVAVLDVGHLVRRELAELQRGYGESIRLRQENERMRVELADLKLTKGTVIKLTGKDIPELTAAPEGTWKMVNCPLCTKPISNRPGPWYSHMKKIHELTKEEESCPTPPV